MRADFTTSTRMESIFRAVYLTIIGLKLVSLFSFDQEMRN